jgi:hypothetical protein
VSILLLQTVESHVLVSFRELFLVMSSHAQWIAYGDHGVAGTCVMRFVAKVFKKA